MQSRLYILPSRLARFNGRRRTATNVRVDYGVGLDEEEVCQGSYGELLQLEVCEMPAEDYYQKLK